MYDREFPTSGNNEKLLRRVCSSRLFGLVTIVRRLLAIECRLPLRIATPAQLSPEAQPKQNDPPRENNWQVVVQSVHTAVGPYCYENLVEIVVWPSIA